MTGDSEQLRVFEENIYMTYEGINDDTKVTEIEMYKITSGMILYGNTKRGNTWKDPSSKEGIVI